MSNFPHGIKSYGSPVIGEMPTAGNVYFLDPANGNDANSGKSVSSAFKTLTAAYAALTANQNDILYYLAGASSITLSAQLVWAKNYTHFIGVCAPTQVGQRARVFQDSAATGLSPLVDITASGCIFKNLYIFQGVADATSLIDVRINGGQRNYFENVHFAGGGHATQAISGGASLYLAGGASENTFESCTIGVDTISAATGMAALVYDAAGGQARNIFRNCHFTLEAGNSGVIHVSLLGNSGLDRYQIFDHCWFTNLATTMTQSFLVAAGFDPANKRILLKDCARIGATKWDNGDTGIIYGNMNAVTGADGSGLMVQMIT